MPFIAFINKDLLSIWFVYKNFKGKIIFTVNSY